MWQTRHHRPRHPGEHRTGHARHDRAGRATKRRTLGEPWAFGEPGTLGEPGTVLEPRTLGEPGTLRELGTLGPREIHGRLQILSTELRDGPAHRWHVGQQLSGNPQIHPRLTKRGMNRRP